MIVTIQLQDLKQGIHILNILNTVYLLKLLPVILKLRTSFIAPRERLYLSQRTVRVPCWYFCVSPTASSATPNHTIYTPDCPNSEAQLLLISLPLFLLPQKPVFLRPLPFPAPHSTLTVDAMQPRPCYRKRAASETEPSRKVVPGSSSDWACDNLCEPCSPFVKTGMRLFHRFAVKIQ